MQLWIHSVSCIEKKSGGIKVSVIPESGMNFGNMMKRFIHIETSEIYKNLEMNPNSGVILNIMEII